MNKKPPHIKILGVTIKSYIWIKNVIKNSWDCIAYNKKSASHLLTLKNVEKTITHEGNAINTFESDYLRQPFFNWNPPIRNILTIACDYDVDDNLIQLNFDYTDDNDNGIVTLDTSDTRGTPSGDDNFGGNQSTHNGLLYSNFTNNWEIMVPKLNQLDQSGVLIIRAIIFKNKAVM